VNAFGDESTLRPLGLGEILDRGVNLCVKHIVPLSLIFLVYAAPAAIVQYYATKDFSRMMQALTDALQTHGPGGQPDLSGFERAVHSSSGTSAWSIVYLAAGLILSPLPTAALIAAVSAFYLGKTVTFGEAYRVASRRWLAVLGVNLMYFFAAIIAYIAIIIVVVVLALIITLLIAALHVVGTAIAVIFGIVFLIALLGFVIVAILAWEVSLFTCVIEGANFATSFANGISRVLAAGLRRSLFTGLAFVAIFIGLDVVVLVGQAVSLALLHSWIVATAYVTIVQVATTVFITAFLAIFYYDLRVREEGLDLQLAAQTTQPEALPAT